MKISLAFIAVLHFACSSSDAALTESQMREKLSQYNTDALKLCNRNVKANWNVATDVGNKEKEKEKVRLWSIKFEFEFEWVDCVT